MEEAGFLWTLWESSLDSPSFTLQEVAEGEEARDRSVGGARAASP